MQNIITPKQKGLNTQLHCISYFSDCGFLVSTPYGDNGRYDLIVDVNGNLLRIQVKTSSIWLNSSGEEAGIKFSCKSARIHTKTSYSKRYTKEEIDYFATYWNHQVYVVPVEETANEKIIHFYESKNNQDYKMSFLEDYTITKQWSKYLIQDYSSEEIQMLEPQKDNVIIQYNKNIEKEKRQHFCARCGTPIDKTAKMYCAKCAAFLRRKVDRPSREELKKMIRNISFTQIAKEFGVSDKAISKWCIAENLPHTKTEIKTYSDEDWEKI